MPLQKLKFRPGINRESTTLANEGGWFQGDKIRFRSGYPEKIGGWTGFSGFNTYLGVARSLWNWVTLSAYNLLGVGTNLKFYIENGGAFYDITPIRYSSVIASNAFTTIENSAVVTITDPGCGVQTGDYVDISLITDPPDNVNGIPIAQLTGSFRATSLGAGVYTITARAVATSTGTATNGAHFDYEISPGGEIFQYGTGWGAGGWNAGSPTDPWAHGWGTGFTTGVDQQLRLWSQANFGERLLFNPRGGALYVWNPGAGTEPDYTSRGTLISSTDAPTIANYILVSDATRIVICFGCNDYGSSTQDPLLIRWSDAESYTSWTPSVTNQAGSYRLSHGSQLITALQTRQEIIVWTDSAVYSMQYAGQPYVYVFNILADNTSIAGPNAAVTVNGITYWMGVDKFYVYSGRVDTLPCSLRQYIYDDINLKQAFQFFGGTNEGYNEIWWYYCSANSTVVDKYVIYNHLDRVWYYGNLERSAWLDSGLRPSPMAATYIHTMVYHEDGVDDNSTPSPTPINSYILTSDFDIGEGHNLAFVWRMVPDVSFDGSYTDVDTFPSVNFTVYPRANPGAYYGADETNIPPAGNTDSPEVTTGQSYSGPYHTYVVQQFTQQIYTRVRGRQMAFQISSNTLGTQWQLGTPRLDVRPDGRR